MAPSPTSPFLTTHGAARASWLRCASKKTQTTTTTTQFLNPQTQTPTRSQCVQWKQPDLENHQTRPPTAEPRVNRQSSVLQPEPEINNLESAPYNQQSAFPVHSTQVDGLHSQSSRCGVCLPGHAEGQASPRQHSLQQLQRQRQDQKRCASLNTQPPGHDLF